MTRSVYVIGGAASGKSTFMAALLDRLGAELGPLEDLWSEPNSRGTLITLRGHRWPGGVYLGKMRDSHPGTDGLDRVSSVAAVEWAKHGELPAVVVGEGLTLAHAGFLSELPGLIVVHLTASLEEINRRCAERGSSQAQTFLVGTATRARNLAAALPCQVLQGGDLEIVLDLVAFHLRVG